MSQERPQSGGGDSQSPRAPIQTLEELRGLVVGKDAFEVLDALFAGDPLRLRDRCRKWLTEQARLLDPGELASRSVMHVVNGVDELEDGEKDLDPWLRSRCEPALWALMADEELAAQRGDPLTEPIADRFRVFRALQIAPAMFRRACSTFNGLPDLERKAAWSMVVMKEGFTGFADRSGLSDDMARDIMVSAIEKILDATEEKSDG